MARPPPPDRMPLRIFPMRHCTVTFHDTFAWTQFPSGQGYGAVPSDDLSYRTLAARLGYGDDILAYCLEHDFLHSFIEQEVFDRPSPILYALAHDLPPPPTTCTRKPWFSYSRAFCGGMGYDGDPTRCGLVRRQSQSTHLPRADASETFPV